MKKNLIQFKKILGTHIVLLVMATASYGVAGAGTTTDTKAAPASESRRSVFEENSRTGKDPFFPNSTRRSTQLPTPENTVAPVIQLSLKGISGPANRRFALINNKPLGVGESAFVRVPGGQIKVHCWEIGEDYVIVSIAGNPERKQLKLRDSL